MYNTYENMLPLALISVVDNECVLPYQETQNPVFLATTFVRHFPMLLQITNNYWGLSSEDKASFCLEEVHKALLNFSADKSTKFSTFLYACIKNRLRAETQSLDTDKRRTVYFVASSADGVNAAAKQNEDEDCFLEIIDKTDVLANTDLLLSIADSALTEREKAYCAYVVKNNAYATATDFAKQQNISSAAVHYIRESLQLKIASVLA